MVRIYKSLPLKYNDEVIGEVMSYEIVGNDFDGHPIVCIEGRIDNPNVLPEFRYTHLKGNSIYIKGLAS